MGIGAAFATGLVKGFTQNIQEEKARRLAEQQKIDAFEQTAIQSVLTGKATTSGYDAVSRLIKSAQQQIKDRPDIDIFGRSTDGIDIDFSGIQSAIDSASEYGTTFGTGANQIGFQVDISKGIDAKLGRSYLSEIAGFANSTDFDAKLDKLSDQEFNNLYASMSGARGALVQASKTGKDPALYESIDVMGTETSDMFRGLFKIDEYYKKRYGGQSATGTIPPNNISTVTSSIASLHQQKTGRVPDSVGMVTGQDGNVQYPVLEFTDQASKEQLQLISRNLGVEPLDLLAYWQTDFMRIPGVNSQDQVDILEGSVYLGTSVQFIDGLDPDKDLRMLNQESIDYMVKQADAALLKTGYTGTNRLEAISYMLAPYMEGPKGPSKPRTYGTTRTVKAESVQQYILKRVYGEDKADEVSFKDFRDGQTALESTYTRIGELETEIQGLDAPAAYDAFKGKLSAIFDPTQGMFGGVLKDLGLSPGRAGELNLNDNENLTVEYSEELNRRIQEAGKDGEQYAKLEAMRISLAFEMARAADPSGRLSNQDIEQQLKKLGSNWQTVDQATAAIQVAKKEFKIKSEQYKIFVRLGDSQRTATERDYKVIDATISADYLLRNKGVKHPTGTASSKTQIDTSNIVRLPNGNLVDQTTGLPATQDQVKAFEATQTTEQGI